VPALVPLVLDPHPLAGLEGIAFPVELRVLDGQKVVARVTGPMLVTHFGVSGPAALDVSRHWSVAAESGRRLDVRMSLYPGLEAQDVERVWLEIARTDGRRSIANLLRDLPRRVAERLMEVAGSDPGRRLGDLPRDARARLLGACTALPLPVKDTRGFNAAEVTAGGVPTSEVDPRTMESRVCPGLHLVGEILDVEGRLGGFNFQWAWASGFVAGQALATAAGAAP
jgi:predicted Rossmann fold flavoprotein